MQNIWQRYWSPILASTIVMTISLWFHSRFIFNNANANATIIHIGQMLSRPIYKSYITCTLALVLWPGIRRL